MPQSQGRQIKAKGRQFEVDIGNRDVPVHPHEQLGAAILGAGQAISSAASSVFDSLAKGNVGIPNSAIKQSVQQGALGSISGGKGGKGNSMMKGK